MFVHLQFHLLLKLRAGAVKSSPSKRRGVGILCKIQVLRPPRLDWPSLMSIPFGKNIMTFTQARSVRGQQQGANPLPNYVEPEAQDGYEREANGSATPAGHGLYVTKVFVVTDRSLCANGVYTSVPHDGGGTQYLVRTVSVPENIQRGGKLENPPLGKHADPKKHVVIMPNNAPRTTWDFGDDAEKFFAMLRISLQRSEENRILFITPGYHTPMDKYIRIAAKLKFDLNFRGPVVLNSWASGTKLDYFSVEAWVHKCTPQLIQVLDDLRDKVHPDVRLLSIAHSMGGRLLTTALVGYIERLAGCVAKGILRGVALNELQSKREDIREGLNLLPQVVFAASDQSMEEFYRLCDLLQQCRLIVQREGQQVFVLPTLTVYCSREDLPLVVSKMIHPGDARLGRTHACMKGMREGKLRYDFVDVVDTTGLRSSSSKHSYFYQNTWVQDDMVAAFGGRRAYDRMIGKGITEDGTTIYACHVAQLEVSKARLVMRAVFGSYSARVQASRP